MQPRKNHYATLGIPPSASPDMIKKAYRNKALEYHPDKNPNNEAAAVERFRAVREAYEVLSDVDKRYLYDHPPAPAQSISIPSSSAQRTYTQEATPNISEEQIRQAYNNVTAFAIKGIKYFGIFISLSCLIDNLMMRTYAKSASNPTLAEIVRQLILNSTHEENISNPGLFYNLTSGRIDVDLLKTASSPFCDKIATMDQNLRLPGLLAKCIYPAISTFNKTIISNTGLYGLPSEPFFEYSMERAATSLSFNTGFALTYVGVRTYKIHQQNQKFWSASLSNKQKLDRIIILALMIGLVLMGLEAATNALGFVTSLSEGMSVIPNACANACNSLYRVTHVMNGTAHTFQHKIEEATPEIIPSTLEKVTAVMTNTLAPVVTFFGARALGLRNRNRDNENKKDRFTV